MLCSVSWNGSGWGCSHANDPTCRVRQASDSVPFKRMRKRCKHSPTVCNACGCSTFAQQLWCPQAGRWTAHYLLPSCQMAMNSDSNTYLFPEEWLFRYRSNTSLMVAIQFYYPIDVRFNRTNWIDKQSIKHNYPFWLDTQLIGHSIKIHIPVCVILNELIANWRSIGREIDHSKCLWPP